MQGAHHAQRSSGVSGEEDSVTQRAKLAPRPGNHRTIFAILCPVIHAPTMKRDGIAC